LKTPDTNIVIDLDDLAPIDRVQADQPLLVDEEGTAIVDEDADLSSSIPRRAVRNADGTITLPLRYPVTLAIRSSRAGVRTEKYEALTFHRLTGADIRAVQSSSKDSQPIVMLAKSSRIRDAVMNVLFDKMDGGDIADASAVVDSFFGNGRTTGKST
jgi:hypothetical protein